MAEYKMVRLGDICEIQSGGTPSRSKAEYKSGNNFEGLTYEIYRLH